MKDMNDMMNYLDDITKRAKEMKEIEVGNIREGDVDKVLDEFSVIMREYIYGDISRIKFDEKLEEIKRKYNVKE